VGNTITDAFGFYHFINVPPGNDYYVLFGKPMGYVFSPQLVGGFALETNSKADSTGKSALFNVASGASINNIDAGLSSTTTVPVSLLSFTAQKKDKYVMLYWQTSSEQNNSHFDVERSTNANRFQTVGRVAGAGNSATIRRYQFPDQQPNEGINYYRLKQVDRDGGFHYSNITSVNFSTSNEITVEWSPDGQSLQFRFSQTGDDYQLRLYATNGQLIQSTQLRQVGNRYIWKLPVLASGVYVVQAFNSKTSFVQQILVP
jgi:hypothetical protein